MIFVIKKSEISSFSGVFAYYDHNLKLTVLLASADGLCVRGFFEQRSTKFKDNGSGMEHMCELIYNRF